MTVLLEWVAFVLILAGALFMLVAALGVLRLPDLMLRMHAATKAGTLGAGLLLFSVVLLFGETAFTTRALAAIVFLLMTAPVASHAIGRAAYFQGTPLWERTARDELRGRYNPETQTLAGAPEVRSAPPSAPASSR